MKTPIKAALAAALGLGIAATVVPAQAGEQAVPGNAMTRSMTVSYGDLDLSRQAGVDVLYRRLKTAAGNVCGPKGDGRNLTMQFYWKQCYKAALDNAIETVDHVGLSEAHLVQTGRRVGSEQRVAGSN